MASRIFRWHRFPSIIVGGDGTGATPGILTLIIGPTPCDQLVITANGPITGDPELGVTIWYDSELTFTILDSEIVGNTIVYTLDSCLEVGNDTADWDYNDAIGDLAISGTPIDTQVLDIDNQNEASSGLLETTTGTALLETTTGLSLTET